MFLRPPSQARDGFCVWVPPQNLPVHAPCPALLPSCPLPHLSLNSPMFPTFPPALVSLLPLKTARRQTAENPKGCGYRISHTIVPQGDRTTAMGAWGFRWWQLYSPSTVPRGWGRGVIHRSFHPIPALAGRAWDVLETGLGRRLETLSSERLPKAAADQLT